MINQGDSSSLQKLKKLYSYKEQRLKSAKKLELNRTLTSNFDIQQLEFTIKDNINRRMSQSISSGENNLQLSQLTVSSSQKVQKQASPQIKQSLIYNKFIEKYMKDNTNILQLSQEYHPKQNQDKSNFEVSKVMKKRGVQQKSTPLFKNFNKMTQSRLGKKQSIKKKTTKTEVKNVLRKVELIKEEIEKMELVFGKEILINLTSVVSKLRQE